MSLPARQERILSRVAHSLHVSEPHLTSMFAVFTKLARDEDMPRLEALDVSSLPLWGWRQRLTRPRRTRRAASGAGAAYVRGARLRAIVLVPIMLAALAPAVFLGLGGRSVSRYGPAACPQHTAPAPSRHGAFLPVRNDWRANDCPMDDPSATREAGPPGYAAGRGQGPQPRTPIRPRW